MAQNQQGLSLNDNLILNNLNMREVQDLVLSTDYGYNDLLRLSNMFTPNGGAAIGVDNFKFEVPFIGKLGISNTISSTSTSGGNLLITIPSTDTRWRVKDKVQSYNFKQGQITSISGNVLTVSPLNAALSAGDWVAGQSRDRRSTASQLHRGRAGQGEARTAER